MFKIHPKGKSSSIVMLGGAGAVAALVLGLGATGTLSTWTSAIISNDSNSVATASAVILKETAGANTCYSSSSPSNSSSCTLINKYGGTGAPLAPGATQQVDVTFTNIGAANASSFSLAPGACSSTPSTGTPTPTNLCTTAGELTISTSCSPGSAYSSTTAWTDLAYPAGVAPTASKSHTAATGDLNAGASWTCRFTVALNNGASVNDQAVTVSQPLAWTLTK